ncbi:MAG: Rieske (2Fe-2S) protein [Sphingobacteriales bacterium]|nr:MAG: Rieske (2Fe-2S) protein [Sphingobacteriales bacterium]
MDRKEFIKTCCYACLGGAAMSTILQGCASTNYFAKTVLTSGLITISKSEFVQVKKDKTMFRKYVLVKVDKYNYPICIYRFENENYSALLMECTHKGCELQPQKDFLVCPCHGSEFDNKGVVQNPPAEQNLQSFIIKTDHDNVYIYL